MAALNARRMRDGRFYLHGVNKGFRGEGSAPMFTRAPQLFDHFTDAAGIGANFASGAATSSGTKWSVTVGAGTGTSTIAISKTASGGVLNLLAGANAGGATNTLELAGTLVCWEPEELAGQQRLMFEARVRMNSLAQTEAFWGLSDVVTAAVKTGSIFTLATNSTATLGTNNAFLFGYSSLPTSGALDISSTTTNYLGLISAVTGTTTAYVASTGLVGDTLFHVYTLLVDAAGNVDAFVDDKFVGYTQFVAASGKGVNPTVAFTPYFSVQPTTGAAPKNIDIDYIAVASAWESSV